MPDIAKDKPQVNHRVDHMVDHPNEKRGLKKDPTKCEEGRELNNRLQTEVHSIGSNRLTKSWPAADLIGPFVDYKRIEKHSIIK